MLQFLTVRHVTTYRYKQPVAFGEHRLMFRPRDSHDQRLLHTDLAVSPEPASVHWTHDVFGNCVACVRFANRRATSLRFESTIELEHRPMHTPDFPVAEHAELFPFSYDQEDMPDLLRSIERQYPDRGNELSGWATDFVRGRNPVRTADLLARMTETIHRDFTYVRREEMGIQPPLQTLKLRSGSCRDFALLMMEAVRALGLAARFVSGYLYVPTSGTAPVGGGATHAWMQVFVPGAGWLEFDPTNGIAGSRNLIRVAIARDPAQAVPLWGSWMGFPADSLGLTVDVAVTAAPAPQHKMPIPPPERRRAQAATNLAATSRKG
ncbi:MAG: transglutaminase family protein [Acetobacteraceae bacterium]